jgi:hypothetical protein
VTALLHDLGMDFALKDLGELHYFFLRSLTVGKAPTLFLY